MDYIFALAGNPNSGKSTLFNELTGGTQYVGNWPGVTVEKKEGIIKNTNIKIMDLPGTYSLRPSSPEQKLARDYIKSGEPSVVINIIDATNLERNLFLTIQLIELGVPVVGALNMMDLVESNGSTIDIDMLEKKLGIPFVPISASKGNNLEILIEKAKKAVEIGNLPTSCALCSHPCRNSAQGYNLAFEATRAALKKNDDGKPSVSDKIDKVLLNKYAAIPIFLLIMLSVFAITFSGPVTFISDLISNFFDNTLIKGAFNIAETLNLPNWIADLIGNGIITGVGGVLTFIPQITILFLLLALLEDSGYMVRAAYILDRAMRRFGLGGKAFIPMIIGFGCSVPAIMATRTLDSDKERKITALVTPFISCSARLPIYILFTGVFFANNQNIIVFSMYLLGIIIALISAFFLSKIIGGKESSQFLLEIPPYRVPTLKNTLLHVWERVFDFIERAGTIIFVASIIVWFCSSYTFTLAPAQMDNSIISVIGKAIAPIFWPLGFADWRAAVAILTGVAAKEVVVSTLQILSNDITTIFTRASAVAFMVFTLLYIPCVATIAVIKNEFKSTKWAVFAAAYQLVTAYIVAFLIFTFLLVIRF